MYYFQSEEEAPSYDFKELVQQIVSFNMKVSMITYDFVLSIVTSWKLEYRRLLPYVVLLRRYINLYVFIYPLLLPECSIDNLFCYVAQCRN